MDSERQQRARKQIINEKEEGTRTAIITNDNEKKMILHSLGMLNMIPTDQRIIMNIKHIAKEQERNEELNCSDSVRDRLG